MRRWEIFDPTDGRPLLAVPFKWLAKALVHLFLPLADYCREGEGWTDGRGQTDE